MESIKELAKAKVLIVRQPIGVFDKQEQVSVNCVDIVVGDVINIKDGQKIPADLRVMKYTAFKLDNSSLTVNFILIVG